MNFRTSTGTYKLPAIFVLIPATYFYCFILVTEGPPAMYCLLEIVAVARKKLASQFVKHLDWIKVRLTNDDTNVS